jgi:transposase, IS30 family
MDRWFSAAEKAEIWDRYEAGEDMRPISRAIGRSSSAVRDLIKKSGGVRPLVPTEWSERRLSLDEREEISRGVAGGESARQIALRIGRAPSTISREIAANAGRSCYRACEAHTRARLSARRPKVAKLARRPRLRRVVEAKLEKRWSPQQIADWLFKEYPDDPEMWVSHETIYMSLFVQGRGALRQELTRCLRQGRAVRRPKGARQPTGGGVINDMVMISERPACQRPARSPQRWPRRTPADGHENSPRTAMGLPQGRPRELPADGHVSPWSQLARGTTPFPDTASARRTDSPSVTSTWA